MHGLDGLHNVRLDLVFALNDVVSEERGEGRGERLEDGGEAMCGRKRNFLATRLPLAECNLRGGMGASRVKEVTERRHMAQ